MGKTLVNVMAIGGYGFMLWLGLWILRDIAIAAISRLCSGLEGGKATAVSDDVAAASYAPQTSAIGYVALESNERIALQVFASADCDESLVRFATIEFLLCQIRRERKRERRIASQRTETKFHR